LRFLLVLFLVFQASCSGSPGDFAVPVDERLCRPRGASVTSEEIGLTRVFPEVQADSLIGMVWEPTGEGFITLDQRGVLARHDAVGSARQVILDWSDRVLDPWRPRGGESGLLGLALHPNWPQDGRAWVSAVLAKGTPEECPLLVVAELARRPDGSLDPEPTRLLLSRRNNCWRHDDGTFQSVHHGGTLHFDPRDGRLVVGLGEMNRSELAGDPSSLEGAFLAIDIDAPGGSGVPGVYAPAEVLGWGFRNPWKWSFDRETNEIWVGDVGGRRFEELGRLERGGHHGWPVFEAETCRREPCVLAPRVAPAYSYDHGDGCAVIGGYVYRGQALPDLRGVYLFSDFCNGRISGLFPDGEGGVRESLLAHTEIKISSFAQGPQGEIYVVEIGGRIHRITAWSAAEDVALPRLLSASGCLPENEDDLIAFDVLAPLWSDGAAKRRWLSIPPDSQIGIDEHGDLDFPRGTVFVKEFSFGGRPLETRLLARHEDGTWNGTSYAWRADSSDAELVAPAGETRWLEDEHLDWRFPGRQECMRCHTVAAGRTLGAELAQMHAAVGGDDPISILVDRGALEAVVVERLRAAMAFPSWFDDPADEEEMERSLGGYLHANCSFCHQPDGIARTSIDFRFFEWPHNTGVCGVDIEYGFLPVAKLLRLTPGDARRSAVWQRMRDLGEHRMPPLATERADDLATARLAVWIEGLESCPEATRPLLRASRHARRPAEPGRPLGPPH
jgi:glucose/arabinose dehydrogenase